MKVEQFNRTLQQYSLTLRQASQVRARLTHSKEKLFEAVSQMDPLVKGSFTPAELLSLWPSALVFLSGCCISGKEFIIGEVAQVI